MVNSQTKLCPHCAETIQAAARKCRYCGEWLADRASLELESREAPTGDVVSATTTDGIDMARTQAPPRDLSKSSAYNAFVGVTAIGCTLFGFLFFGAMAQASFGHGGANGHITNVLFAAGLTGTILGLTLGSPGGLAMAPLLSIARRHKNVWPMLIGVAVAQAILILAVWLWAWNDARFEEPELIVVLGVGTAICSVAAGVWGANRPPQAHSLGQTASDNPGI